MNKIDPKIKLPQKFYSEYRAHIATRLIGSIVFLVIATVFCLLYDFRGTKSIVMAYVMVFAVAIVLACLIFRVHVILFKPGWQGTIINVEAGYKQKSRGDKGKPVQKMVVTVTIDRGDEKPYIHEIIKDDANGDNPYQVYAPYKVGDTVLYFRGMKFFARYDVKNAEELLDTLFVCPYCGEINKHEREKCYKCGKLLIK